MNETVKSWVQLLEAEWSKPEGFLGKVREGVFDQRRAADFLTMLENIKLPASETSIDRRLVSLLWYIQNVLGWQMHRVIEQGGDCTVFEHFANQVQGTIEEILGVP